MAFVDRRAQCTEQAGIYWKINHKSSHLSDKERFSQSTSPVWPVGLHLIARSCNTHANTALCTPPQTDHYGEGLCTDEKGKT